MVDCVPPGVPFHLEDMYPTNIFVEQSSDTPVCIDCIVKFRRDL